MYLANQYHGSLGSPGNLASPAPADVVLPQSVEELIVSICNEQSQPPLGANIKRKLALLGEEEALRLLGTIRKSKISRSFEGFVMYLMKNDSPSPASPKQESIFSSPSRPSSSASITSPNFCAVDGVTYSVQDHLTLSPISAAGQPGGPSILPCINNQQYNEQASSHATSLGIPIGQTFYPLTNVSNPNGQCLTLSPIGAPRQLVGPSVLPCINNRQYNEQASSHTTSLGTPNGHIFSPLTNAGNPNGQCLTLSPIGAPRQLVGPSVLPCINNWQYNEQASSHATSLGTPNGQIFSPLTNVGNPNGQCLTLSPIGAPRQLVGPSVLPCINNWQYNDQASSHATSLGTPNGQIFSPLTNVGNPNGQCLTLSPIGAPRQLVGPSVLPCINNWQSNEQPPSHTINVGIPSGQTFSPSSNVGMPNEQCLMSSRAIMNSKAQALVPSRNAWKASEQTSGPVLQAPNAQALVSSTNTWKPSGQTSGAVLHALHELEFRKAFLILSYIGRNKLEEVTCVAELKDLGAVHAMGAFENRIWDRFGSRYCEKKDRVKQIDWDSGRRYYYHCYVCSDGSYSLKGPFLNKTATLLQKVLGDENVLIVKFYDLDSSRKNYGPSVSYTGYRKVEKEGIFVGLKHFRFFVFKDGGKEEKQNSSSGAIKSYYVNVDSFERFYEKQASFFDMMSMHDQRCIFMHVHNLSSLSAYMARFSLILSKTITLEVNLNDPDVHVEVIDDMPCKDVNGLHIYDKDGKLQIHTDGTGYISEELALRCPQNCFKGTSLNDRFFERYLEIVQPGTSTSQLKPDMLQPPLLIQFRMFHKGRAVKGTVLLNKKLQGKRIQIRPSMIKVEPDPGLSCIPAVNSFEIVSTSIRPRKPRLSRYLIALLNYGGVPRDFFIGILVNEIWDAHNILSNKRAALKVAVNYGEMDDNYTVARMILSGIPLDEPYIQWRLSILGKVELKSLKEGKLPIQDSFYVMGTTDPTGCLNSNEVCIIHETGQFEGDVLVYRTPGVHFGDVHILKAKRVKGLEDIVGTSKYGIFFPTNGPRSLADKMAGGDFDGDMYFVSRHPKLLTCFRQSEPWTPTPLCSKSTSVSRKPSEFTAEELEHELFQLFLTTRFQPCNSAGMAANSWLSYMDEMLSLGDEQKDKKLDLQKKMLRLVDIYYEALDAPKKGKKVVVPRDLIPKKYPHFMRKADQYSYKSTSVLGEIFDKADELQLETPAVQVWKLPCFDIKVPLRCITSWEGHYERYKSEMSDALKSGDEKDAAANNVIEKYKQILYGADEFEKSPREWEEIRFDALAMYHVVYGCAMQSNQVNKCGFAWKVAGSALMKIYMEEQDEKPVYCLPSVLREIL